MDVYVVQEDTGNRLLIALRCDKCDAEILPHKDIAKSGWIEVGYGSLGDWSIRHYCDKCANRNAYQVI